MTYLSRALIIPAVITALLVSLIPAIFASGQPEITNVGVNVTETSAEVSWQTNNHAADSRLDYAIYPDAPGTTVTTVCGGYPPSSVPVNNHCIRITGLSAGTKYNFKAKSFDVTWGTGEYDGNFTSADNTFPSVSITTPTNNSTVSGTILIEAIANDNVAVVGVQFKLDGSNLGGEDTSSPFAVNWDTSSSANGSHSLTAVARDAAGNATTSATVTVTASNVAGSQQQDTSSPSVPSGLSGSSPSSSTVNLNWTGSTDNVGVTRYEVYRNDVSVSDNVSVTSFSDSGLNAATAYVYKVRAWDAAGNVSGFSNSVTVITLALTGNQSPSVPQSVTAQVLSSSSIKVSWNQSTDDVAVQDYLVFRGTSEIATVTATNYTDSGLLTSTTYSYRVKARDAQGAVSALSNAVEATTSSSPTPPPPGSSQGDTKTIQGRVQFSNNFVVTDAEVRIYNASTGTERATTTSSSGSYSFTVSGGQWAVNISPLISANWVWSGLSQTVAFADNNSSEEKTVDFIVPLTTAKLSVKVIDFTGKALTGVGVMVDSVSARERALGVYSGTSAVKVTDALGFANFNLEPGIFYVRAVSATASLVPPEERSVQIAKNTETAIALQFNTSTIFVTGTAKLQDGRNATDALVWAWSEKGGSAQVRASSSGEFSIPVSSNSRWHIGASKLDGTNPYRSDETVVDVGGASISLNNLILKKADVILPNIVATTKSVQESSVITLTDGTRIEIPAGAAPVSGNISINVNPTVEVPVQFNNVVGAVYDIVLKDNGGIEIESLNKKIELSFPYSDKDLKDLGITADQLIPSFYDDNAGLWVRLNDYFIDKLNKLVVVKISHFTRFALVSAADIIPPAPPTDIRAVQVGNNVMIRWTNPKDDFRHTKIYRSAQKGILGMVIFPEVQGSSRTDTTAASGVAYYYVVRAVDPAGNESTNIDQVPVSQGDVGEVVSSGSIGRNLRRGVTGEDVSLLQQLLVGEGVYPEALITGYFGNLTESAVVRFQDKYSKDILGPAGLSRGSGFVGPLTRAKLNDIIK